MYEPFKKAVYLKLIHSQDSDFILTDDAIVKITINCSRTCLPNAIVENCAQHIRLGSPALSRKRLRAALKKINRRLGVAYHLKGSWSVRLLGKHSTDSPDLILAIGCQRFSGNNLNALYTWLNLPRPMGSK